MRDRSEDAILRGQLRLIQPARGPRVTTDPLLLGHFMLETAKLRPRRACDLGTGTGVLGLLLALRTPALRVSCIELQPALCEMATRAAALNGLAERVEVIEADLRQLGRPAPRLAHDLVVANPPYFAQGGGPVSPGHSRALAHHELGCSLGDVVAAAERLTTPRGCLGLILPADRLADMMALLGKHRFALRRLRFVHPRPGRPAARLLVLAQKGARARPVVEAPLILHEGPGYSPEGQAIVDGTW